MDIGAVDVLGQQLGTTAADGGVAWLDRGRVYAVRAVGNHGGRGPVLRGHRSAALPRDRERGQLRGGRGRHVVSVCGGRRAVRRPRTVHRPGRVPLRIPASIRRAALRRAVCHCLLGVREDMHGRAPEQRTGTAQRIRA